MRWLRRGVHALLLFAFWVVLAGGTRPAELVAGGAAALVGTACAEGLRGHGALRWLPPPGQLLRWGGRVLWRTLLDTFVVLWAVVRALAGRRVQGAVVALRFPAGGDDDRAVGRRALATAGLSLSPNSVVLDIDREEGCVRVHQLVPGAREGEDWRVLL